MFTLFKNQSLQLFHNLNSFILKILYYCLSFLNIIICVFVFILLYLLTVKQKINLSTNDSIRLVVEEDGTEIECSFEMMQAMGSNLIYTLLLNGEKWSKQLPQVEALKLKY